MFCVTSHHFRSTEGLYGIRYLNEFFGQFRRNGSHRAFSVSKVYSPENCASRFSRKAVMPSSPAAATTRAPEIFRPTNPKVGILEHKHYG